MKAIPDDPSQILIPGISKRLGYVRKVYQQNKFRPITSPDPHASPTLNARLFGGPEFEAQYGIRLSVTKRDHEIKKVQSSPGQINIFRHDGRFRVQSRDGVGVALSWSSIGTTSGRGNLCAGSYWSGGIPNVIGSRVWRREVPIGVYSVS
jgi:hypothetical protein